MNEFDQFMKHHMQVKRYARYTDDFVILSHNQLYLEQFLLPHIQFFLNDALRLALHPNKVTVQPFHQGVDFLGYVIFPHYRVLRSKTKKRMLRRLRQRGKEYDMGILSTQSI